MSSPITEIVTLSASDALKADHSIFAEFKHVLGEKTTPGGMLQQSWGFREEQPDTWQGFLYWVSLEHHKKIGAVLLADKEFGEQLNKAVSGPAKIVHVPFTPFENSKRAIAAPVTEIIFASLKDGADPQAFKDAVETALDTAGTSQGCTRGAWGWTVEDEKKAVIVIGWESSETHDNYTKTASEAPKEQFMKVANVEGLFHIKLQ